MLVVEKGKPGLEVCTGDSFWLRDQWLGFKAPIHCVSFSQESPSTTSSSRDILLVSILTLDNL